MTIRPGLRVGIVARDVIDRVLYERAQATKQPRCTRTNHGKRCPNRARPGRKWCEPCATYLSEVKRRRRQALLAMGRCTECGKAPPMSRKRKCADCWSDQQEYDATRSEESRVAHRAAVRRRKRAYRAAGFCACGRDRAPGRESCRSCLWSARLSSARRTLRRVAPYANGGMRWRDGRPPDNAGHIWRKRDHAGARQTQWHLRQQEAAHAGD